MSVTVKFFASLREMPGIADSELPVDGIATVEDAWQQATDCQAPPNNLLCAVNHQHAEFDSEIKDGDEIAFFPPVTGG